MAVMWYFLHDESGATTAKVSLVASSLALLAYGLVQNGSVFHQLTGSVASAMTVAIRNLVGGGYYGY